MPTPVSRKFLRELKAKKDEEKRIKGVNERVNYIYNKTIEAAELYSDTSYKFPLTYQERHGGFSISDFFYGENMRDILVCLQIVFPDCSITRVHEGSAFEGILIDWS
jgi:hypothetical protein